MGNLVVNHAEFGTLVGALPKLVSVMEKEGAYILGITLVTSTAVKVNIVVKTVWQVTLRDGVMQMETATSQTITQTARVCKFKSKIFPKLIINKRQLPILVRWLSRILTHNEADLQSTKNFHWPE